LGQIGITDGSSPPSDVWRFSRAPERFRFAVAGQETRSLSRIVISLPRFDLIFHAFHEAVDIFCLPFEKYVAIQIKMGCHRLPYVFGNEVDFKKQAVNAVTFHKLRLDAQSHPSSLSVARKVITNVGMDSGFFGELTCLHGCNERGKAYDRSANGQIKGSTSPVSRFLRSISRLPLGAKVGLSYLFTIGAAAIGYVGFGSLNGRRNAIQGIAFSVASVGIILSGLVLWW